MTLLHVRRRLHAQPWQSASATITTHAMTAVEGGSSASRWGEQIASSAHLIEQGRQQPVDSWQLFQRLVYKSCSCWDDKAGAFRGVALAC
jgi:hypothetical protein